MTLLPPAPGMDSRLISLTLDLAPSMSRIFMPLTQRTQATSESCRILNVMELNISSPDIVTQGSLSLSLSAPSLSQSYQGNGAS